MPETYERQPSRTACVIDCNRYYKDLVLVDFIPKFNEAGVFQGYTEIPQYFQMSSGDSLVYIPNPPTAYMTEDGQKILTSKNQLLKPRLKGTDTWEEGATPEEIAAAQPVITPEMVETARQAKLNETNAACQAVIAAGVDVETSQGTKHFSLTSEDQINISGLAVQLQNALEFKPSAINLANGVPYHADGELCRFWSPEDFKNISDAAVGYLFYHTTYCNHLRVYIKRITNIDELNAVTYGMPLPADLAASMAALINA